MSYKNYRDILNALRAEFPNLEFLRTPSSLDAGSGGDIDLLVASDSYEPLRRWLAQAGFREETTFQPFRHTWRCRRTDRSEPLTVDVYTAEKWGMGVQLTARRHRTEPKARLLRALFDKADTTYFDSTYPDRVPSEIFDDLPYPRLTDLLWKRDALWAVRPLILLSPTVEIDESNVRDYLCNYLQFRLGQLSGKRGLEVAVVGVDGSGKSTLTSLLDERLPTGTRRMYMGNSDHFTPMMRRVSNADQPPPGLHFLCRHLDNFARRLTGYLFAKRGYIVLYDRHPAERLRMDESWKRPINNAFVSSYAFGVDVTIWLRGAVEHLHGRKPEHSPEKLRELRAQLDRKLEAVGANPINLDSVENDPDQLYHTAAQLILDRMVSE